MTDKPEDQQLSTAQHLARIRQRGKYGVGVTEDKPAPPEDERDVEQLTVQDHLERIQERRP